MKKIEDVQDYKIIIIINILKYILNCELCITFFYQYNIISYSDEIEKKLKINIVHG